MVSVVLAIWICVFINYAPEAWRAFHRPVTADAVLALAMILTALGVLSLDVDKTFAFTLLSFGGAFKILVANAVDDKPTLAYWVWVLTAVALTAAFYSIGLGV